MNCPNQSKQNSKAQKKKNKVSKKEVSSSLSKAAQCIQQGGIIALPTEGIMGLSCDPHNDTAIKRLLAIKQRPEHKGLILVAADLTQLRPFIQRLSVELLDKLTTIRKQPTTWITPAHPEISKLITGSFSGVAVRLTTHPLVKALCLACDHALISTSANISTEPNTR
ncbi:DNA topoisomerase I, partial [Bacillus halotolerans]